MKVFIRNNRDYDGLTEAIIEQLEIKYGDVSGIVFDCGVVPRTLKNNVQYRRYEPLGSIYSEELLKAKKSIEGSILKKMLPYKSMAMHIMMRTLNYDVYDRCFLEDRYYAQLKYWDEVLEQNKPNLVIFMVTPHHCGEYILYSLCKIKNIATVMLYPQLSYNGIAYHIGDAIEGIGIATEDRYKEIKEVDEKDLNISSFMEGVVKNSLSNRVIGASDKKKIIKASKMNIYRSISAKEIIVKMLVCFLSIFGRYNNKPWMNPRENFRYTIKAKKYERHMDHLGDYKKLSELPDYSQKYIYFPLQMTPEASTMPLAGEFKNQLLSVELLASAAEKFGLKVYVKEHWVQHNRETDFYKCLSRIKNVKLINLEANSLELTEHSAMVASQTGNCLFEALLKNKYALSIGEGNTFKGAPNIISVKDKEEIENAIDKILNNNITFTDKDIKQYLKALDDTLVYSYLDTLDEAYKDYKKETTAKKIVDFAAKYCEL